MTESQNAWDDVAQQFRSLGRQLQQRYREQSPAGEQADRRTIDDAVRTLADAMEGAIESVGSAVRDTEFRDQAKQAAQTLVDAIGATFTEFGGDIRAGFPPRYTPPGGKSGNAESLTDDDPDDDPEAEWDEPSLPEGHQPT